jgi:hypothetical protein
MNESYVINDGGTGKEVPVPKREDAYKSILGSPAAPTVNEKPKVEPVAGDATVAEYKGSFAGKEEAVVVTPVQEEQFYCKNCRRHFDGKDVRKEPIDYLRNHDGSLSKAASRFSVFCKVCALFLRVIDNDAQKMLSEMIKKGIR